MSRISKVQLSSASKAQADALNTVAKSAGRVPNIFAHMAHAPEVLAQFLSMSSAAEKTSLPPKLREKIALAVAEINQCGYCLAAHTAIAKSKGIEASDIVSSRRAESSDPKEAAVLLFVSKIVRERGQVMQPDVDLIKKNGVSDQEIVEIIFLTVLNIFTNYFNHIVDPEVDFPAAPSLK